MPFSRVLVANRGEIAVRVIRALHELGIEAVAVYSTADEHAQHVRLADRAVRIGPPQASQSYLSMPAIISAATTTGCEAVHPGYGFLSENADFVRSCDDNDLVFIGPPADVMEKMGDKAQAKAEMRAAGVPLVPGTEGTASLEQARVAADELGYPVLLKAAAGGGGRGMRLVTSPAEIDDAYSRASAEAEAAFADGTLYVEKAIAPARHVEIQVMCDAEGGVLTCGERECSIQRRHQKLIEESPSPALDPELREAMESAAERACRHIGYRNAGTFEFLVGPDGSFSFIELNARLQVEHPVTELVTSLDLVRLQIAVAEGSALPLTGRAPRSGHAIEVRINAEDPTAGFRPSPGALERFRAPLGPGVRVDTFVEDGSVISPYYDSLIAKVIVRDATRDACIERARRVLRELDVRGVPTTREAAIDILGSDAFRSGNYSTSFLDEAGATLPALAGA
jgi:acetyl-CoA carboxylase, biotin carboxylase subunit